MQAIQILHDDVAAYPIWDSVYAYTMRKGIDFTPIQHRLPALRIDHVSMSK
jgi:hypothetical protein